MLAAVHSDATLHWSMLQVIAREVTLSWDMTQAIARDATLRWNMLRAVSTASSNAAALILSLLKKRFAIGTVPMLKDSTTSMSWP